MEIRISVRNLVEFVLRSGNIDNRRASMAENAMQEGSRIHRMIQRRMGSEYQAEVSLRYEYETELYSVIVEGRADGIIAEESTGLAAGAGVNQISLPAELIKEQEFLITIDEIKGTLKDINRMRDAVPIHLAQAKCYAYIYGSQMNQKRIRVRMTYCNMDTEEIRYFHFEYSLEELKEWFEGILIEYRKWADFEYHWKGIREKSIKELEFPFEYRQGQKELVTYVYQTIYHGKKLFIEAPTGVGKTISTVFPAVKAIGEKRGERIFYLTAKTITRTVAKEAFQLLRSRGLGFKTVILTAKDKICFMEERECNPEYCPYAKGHYDRINEAIYDLLTHSDDFTRERIEEYAEKYKVCPFEMCLDMSLFSDGVICDYNYVFDPHVYLKRFFSEGLKGDYLFLVDEAHNLVERGREMYSATLCKEDFLRLKKTVTDMDQRLEKQLEKCNKAMLAMKRECETYRIEEYIDDFVIPVTRLRTGMEEFLEIHEDTKDPAVKQARSQVLDFYFEVSHFLEIYEIMDANYVVYSHLEQDGRFLVKLFNVNPSKNLGACMKKARSSILFSATLLPIAYYKELLGAGPEDYEVYAQSIFDPGKKALLIGEDVSSRYTRRSTEEYFRFAKYIYEVVRNRRGNYLVFFPSHAFLKDVFGSFETHFQDQESMECIMQEDYMDEKGREEFLSLFSGNEEVDFTGLIQMEVEAEEGEPKSLIGFCVLGGIFGEGIDLKKDSLIGAVIVGTGLPQVCPEREILKCYFDERGEDGFAYAYRYPGMNKVLQAAGRVIRTVVDVGVIALLDERFLTRPYLNMFPREWEEFEVVRVDGIAKRVERFWDEWL